jgi:aminocarboxymuconate-semialdehyde decarboxylase
MTADQGSQSTVSAIDLHCHLLPQPELSLRYLPVQLGTREEPDEVLYKGASVGKIRRLLTDPRVAIEAMDQLGLERRAMSIAPLSYRYDLTSEEGSAWHGSLNDALAAACADFPDRLVPVGVAPLQDGDAAAAEARRAVRDLGMAGIEIGTRVGDRDLDDPRLEPFWTAVEELGVPLFIHPEHLPSQRWGATYYLVNLVGNPVETAVAVASLIFGGVLTRHPRLRFWLAHGGGAAPWIAGRLRHGWNVRSEPKEHGAADPLDVLAHSFWFDTLTHDPGILAALIQRFGADRVVLGSDAPFDMADPDPVRSLSEAVNHAEALQQRVYRAGQDLLQRSPVR